MHPFSEPAHIIHCQCILRKSTDIDSTGYDECVVTVPVSEMYTTWMSLIIH